MKTKKVFTANLVPGMVIAEAAYTIDNHLVIQSNTEITEDIIDKLKYYSKRLWLRACNARFLSSALIKNEML